jgi:hypothetical protein
MKPEKRNLMHDLLDEGRDGRREATLLAGGRILRRRRWQRLAVRNVAIVGILVMTALALQRMLAPAPPVLTALPSPRVQSGSLTDDELLALFPNTPVGLATLDDGKKRLIFPRPGDEERFITRF